MNVKLKAWDYLQQIKHLTCRQTYFVLLALIENGAVHADEIWMVEKVVEAYEEVMGDEEDE